MDWGNLCGGSEMSKTLTNCRMFGEEYMRLRPQDLIVPTMSKKGS